MIDLALARQQLINLQATVEALRQTLSAQTKRLTPGQSIQAALDDPDVSAIELEDGTYEGALTFARPVILRGVRQLSPGRAQAAGTAPDHVPSVFLTSSATDTLSVLGADVVLIGIGAKNRNADGGIVNITGARTILDRTVLLGDTAKGQHRGITANGKSTQVLNSFVDDCWLPGRDAQALLGWKGTKDLRLFNSYFGGGAESVMFGGADNASVDEIPNGILIDACDISKNPTWWAKGAQIKCALEFKSCLNAVVRNTTLEYAGAMGGQAGYIVQITVRNQSGGNPWATVQNITLENIVARFGGGAVNILGSDNLHPSGPVRNVTLRNWSVSDLDPLDPNVFPVNKGDGRVIQLQRAPDSITIEGFKAINRMNHMRAGVYLVGPPPTKLALRDVDLPVCTFPLKVDNGGAGLAAAQAFAPDAVFERLTAAGVPITK